MLKRKAPVNVQPDEFAANPFLLERFKREAGSVLELNHPSIVEFMHFGVDYNTYFIVMGAIEVLSFRQLINKQKFL